MSRFLAGLVLLLIAAPGMAQTAAEKKAAIEYLMKLRLGDGGFQPAEQDPTLDQAPRATLRATSGASRAIKYLGGELKDKDLSMKYVLSCYDAKTGAFADQPGDKPDVMVTAVGMMAAAELSKDFDFKPSINYLLENAKTFEQRRLAVAGMEAAKTFPAPVDGWLEEIEKTANSTGTFGQLDGMARETGGVTAMFLRAGKKLSAERSRAALEVLVAGQRADGGYGKAGVKSSDMETTYRVMRAFYLMKEKPKNIEKVKAFVAKHRNADGGYTPEPGKPSSVSGTYYAAVIGYWLEK